MTDQTQNTVFDLMQAMGRKAKAASTQMARAQAAAKSVALLNLEWAAKFY